VGKDVGGEMRARERAPPALQFFARPRRCWAPLRRMELLATLRRVLCSPCPRLPAVLQRREAGGGRTEFDEQAGAPSFVMVNAPALKKP